MPLDIPLGTETAGHTVTIDGRTYRPLKVDSEGRLLTVADAHASSHENGGTDEINLAGLSGLLAADLPDPLSADAVIERTAAAGVTVDGLLVKDAQVPLPAGPWTAATDAATVTFDLGVSRLQIVTLGGNRTLALSNVSVGMVFCITLKQDGTGSRTVTWWAGISWAGGSAPTLTTTLNKADTFGFICTAANTYMGFVVGQNI